MDYREYPGGRHYYQTAFSDDSDDTAGEVTSAEDNDVAGIRVAPDNIRYF